MLFDYLIASLAQKAEKIKSFEIFLISKIFSIFEILKNFKRLYFSAFWDKLAIKWSKSISLLRRIDWCALKGRTRGCARAACQSMWHIIWRIFDFFQVWLCGSAISARQSIFLIKEMLFDYLIAIVSWKATEISMSEVTTIVDTLPPSSALQSGAASVCLLSMTFLLGASRLGLFTIFSKKFRIEPPPQTKKAGA